VIFVDALLPHPGRSWCETVSPAFAQRLRRLVRNGRLPRWNQWFAGDPAETLVEDATQWRAFVESLPEVPAGYLEAVAPSTTDWQRIECAYLQRCAAYDTEASQAQSAGWRSAKLATHHLVMITDPKALAMKVSDLAAGMRVR
jgi:hypothetical protein